MGRIRHIAIATRDLEATTQFYIEGLGLKQVGRSTLQLPRATT